MVFCRMNAKEMMTAMVTHVYAKRTSVVSKIELVIGDVRYIIDNGRVPFLRCVYHAGAM